MTIWKSLTEFAGAAVAGGRGLLATLSAATTGERAPATADVRKAQTGVAFTIAVVALSAKMAKADGVVLGVEVAAFRRAFEIAPEDQASVERVFQLAQQDTAGYTTYADNIAGDLDHDPLLLGDILDSLFHIATADRALHPGEDAFLAEVARRFGFTDAAYRHRRSRFVLDPDSPYDVLGLDPAASDTDIKARHRKLVRENHPDLFIGRGMPPETIALATRRLTAINAAYRIIAKERGI
jgi:DnaJ like chaperone protein